MRPFDVLVFIAALTGFVVAWAFVRSRLRVRALATNTDVRAACVLAIREALSRRHASVQPVHFLLALTLDPRGSRTLRAARIDPDAVHCSCEGLVERLGLPRLPEPDRDYRSSEAAPSVAGSWMERFVRRVAARDRATITGLFVQLTFEEQLDGVLEQHAITRDAIRDVHVPGEPTAPAVEVFNDSVTTYDFVVTSLCEVAGMREHFAHAFARAVDVRGREWFEVPSPADADRVARVLVERARAAGFPLDARAVV